MSILVREDFAFMSDSFSKCMPENLNAQCDDQDCWKLEEDFHFAFASGRRGCTWLHLRLQKQLGSTNCKQISHRKHDRLQIPPGNFQDLASFAYMLLMTLATEIPFSCQCHRVHYSQIHPALQQIPTHSTVELCL